MIKNELPPWKQRKMENPSPPSSPQRVQNMEVDEENSVNFPPDDKKFHNQGSSQANDGTSNGDEYCKWDPNLDAYFCSICDSTMNSSHTFHMHLGGKRHQKKLATVRLVADDKVEIPRHANMQEIRIGGEHKVLATKVLQQPAKIQPAIDKEKQPVIGLNYITEILRLDKKQDPIYHCSLCPADCQLSSIIGHVTGLKHRMSYLKFNLPDVYDAFNDFVDKRSSMSDRAEYHAQHIEKKLGRGQMTVEEEMDTSEEKDVGSDNSPLTEEAIQYTKESIKKWPQKEQHEFLLYALNDIFETELAKPVLQERQLALLRNASSDIKRNCIEETVKALDEDREKRITEAFISGDHSAAEELLQFPSAEIGQPIREVIQKLIEKGEYSHN